MPLANITLGSAAATVTFSSISSSYRDLVLVVNCQSAVAGNNVLMRFNGDSGSNYVWVGTRGNGSATFSTTANATQQIYGFFTGNMSTSSPDLFFIANIMDYSATDKHKTVLVRGNKADTAVELQGGRWANTAAINNIVVRGDAGNFAAGSNFALYGVSS